MGVRWGEFRRNFRISATGSLRLALSSFKFYGIELQLIYLRGGECGAFFCIPVVFFVVADVSYLQFCYFDCFYPVLASVLGGWRGGLKEVNLSRIGLARAMPGS